MKRIPSKGIGVMHNELFDWLIVGNVSQSIGDFPLYNELDQITKRDEED